MCDDEEDNYDVGKTLTNISEYLRGTQDPNLSGNSDIRSSLILSFIGPRIITGLA